MPDTPNVRYTVPYHQSVLLISALCLITWLRFFKITRLIIFGVWHFEALIIKVLLRWFRDLSSFSPRPETRSILCPRERTFVVFSLLVFLAISIFSIFISLTLFLHLYNFVPFPLTRSYYFNFSLSFPSSFSFILSASSYRLLATFVHPSSLLPFPPLLHNLVFFIWNRFWGLEDVWKVETNFRIHVFFLTL